MKPTTILSLTLLTFGVGCASVEVKHVAPDDKSDAVHFYEPRPYLLIAKDVKKDSAGKDQISFSSQIIYLPDTSQRYSVKIKPGWGTVDGSVKLQNGWMLDTLGAKSDSKIPETITALTGLAKEIAAMAAAPPEGLYLIKIATDGSVSLVKQAGWQ